MDEIEWLATVFRDKFFSVHWMNGGCFGLTVGMEAVETIVCNMTACAAESIRTNLLKDIKTCSSSA
jgi:hypothetical protein